MSRHKSDRQVPLFWRYLWKRRKAVSFFLLFAGIFLLVFFLYRLPVAAVGYAVLVCAVFSAFLVTFDFLSFRRRHERLRQLMTEITYSIDHLPVPNGSLEEDYQALLIAQHNHREALVQEMENRFNDSVDYYTIWAHQIKTPIAAMYLLLQSGDADNRELTAELQRIEQYVEMVMGYLRLSSQSSDYVIRQYDLDTIIRQAVRKYASQFIRKRIKLQYEPLNVRVLTDEKWLLFVIEQVLTNALKYTKAGSITISLEAPKTLCIRDTGIGIATEDIPRVFDKGFTGYNGRSDKKASGIGLYLCRSILKRLNHSIFLTSEEGVGTAVHINLDTAELSVE